LAHSLFDLLNNKCKIWYPKSDFLNEIEIDLSLSIYSKLTVVNKIGQNSMATEMPAKLFLVRE